MLGGQVDDVHDGERQVLLSWCCVSALQFGSNDNLLKLTSVLVLSTPSTQSSLPSPGGAACGEGWVLGGQVDDGHDKCQVLLS